MSDGTKIEWTDATWNVVNGCSVVSPGCTNCYAMKQAHRFPIRQGLTRKTNGGMVWTGEVRFAEQMLLQPLRWKRPRRIFVCAHGDLFHEKVPDEWIDRVFAVMALAPQHTFQVLTKRPERMRAYLTGGGRRQVNACVHIKAAAFDFWERKAGRKSRFPSPILWPLPNVWLGTSVEDQKRADERIPILLDTPAAVRWLSCEPLLGPVDLTDINGQVPEYGTAKAHGIDVLSPHNRILRPQIDWVVVGGESGPGARPMHPDWARSLRDQCAAAGVPFLFKQWGEWGPDQGDGGLDGLDRVIRADALNWADGAWRRLPKLISEREIGDDDVYRIGKKAAGRLLDGVQHDGYPA